MWQKFLALLPEKRFSLRYERGATFPMPQGSSRESLLLCAFVCLLFLQEVYSEFGKRGRDIHRVTFIRSRVTAFPAVLFILLSAQCGNQACAALLLADW